MNMDWTVTIAMNYGDEIEHIRKENFNLKIQSELAYLRSNENMFNLSDKEIGMRIDGLSIVLGSVRKAVDKKEEMFKEMEKHVYKKQWNRLTPFHKIVKIKEYIKEQYGEGDMQGKMIGDLIKLVNDNNFNTKKLVTYDPNMEKILAMSCLVVNIDKGTYQIKLVY